MKAVLGAARACAGGSDRPSPNGSARRRSGTSTSLSKVVEGHLGPRTLRCAEAARRRQFRHLRLTKASGEGLSVSRPDLVAASPGPPDLELPPRLNAVPPPAPSDCSRLDDRGGEKSAACRSFVGASVGGDSTTTVPPAARLPAQCEVRPRAPPARRPQPPRPRRGPTGEPLGPPPAGLRTPTDIGDGAARHAQRQRPLRADGVRPTSPRPSTCGGPESPGEQVVFCLSVPQ